MRIVGRDILDKFKRRHSRSRASLDAWASLVEANRFDRFSRLKGLFQSADFVKPLTVFNVGGNKYRLVARIDYDLQVVLIKDVLTHEEYDRERWKK